MNPSFRATLLAAAIAALPFSADAAGLGKLTVHSALGQPLRAEVDIAATREELASLSARLASADAFRQAGIEFAPALAGIRFSVGQRPNGQAVLRLSSDRPLNEPFLEMMIELNWAAGRLVREYTFLLDPPDSVIARQPTAPVAAPVPAPVRRPQVAVPERPTPPPVTATAPKSEVASTHLVKRGDTLRAIAAATRHDGVSVDQMLMAIFQNNRSAFDRDNMNRLQTGKVLQIPAREAVLGVDPAEARRTVLAQAAEFNAYRRKLAEAAAAAPAAQEVPPQQTAGGKIAPQVAEKAATPATKQDQLRVSKAEGEKEPKTAADAATQGRITAMEEDLVAKDKALKEATARLAELEKSIKDLQSLLEVKNQNLADMQKQAESAKVPPQPPVSAPTAAPPVVAERPSVEPPKVAEAPKPAAPAAEAPAAAPTPTPTIAAAPASPPKPASAAKADPVTALVPEEPGFFAGLASNPAALAGGGALALLLGFAAYKLRQRSREEASLPLSTSAPSLTGPSVFGASGGQSVDTSNSSIQTDFSQSGMTAIDADEGVDPVAEADVYMAYGRDAQAEEILVDALKNEPTRHAIHVKLLEIYAQRKNLKQFETLASELYAQTGGQGAEWEKAAALGRKVDSSNPLYGAPAQESRVAAVAAAAGVASASASASAVAATPENAEVSAKLHDTWAMPGDFGKVATGGETAQPPLAKESDVQPSATPGTLDFELDLAAAAAAPGKVATVAKSAETSNLDFDLELDFETKTAPGPQKPFETSNVLDIGVPGASARAPAHPEDAVRTEVGVSMLDFSLDSAESAHPTKVVDLEKTEINSDVGGFGFNGTVGAEAAKPQVVDLEKTEIDPDSLSLSQARAAAPRDVEPQVVDLEKTEIVADALNFDLRGAGKPAERPSVPVVDLEKTEINADALSLTSGPDAALGSPEPKAPVVDLERTDVGGQFLNFNMESTAAGINAEQASLVDLERTDITSSILNFNLQLDEQSTATDSARKPSTPPAFDFSGIDLNLGESAGQAADQAVAASAEDPEVETKIELARAYEEMGDKDGARELLQEVMKEGSGPQRQRAQDMLVKLG